MLTFDLVMVLPLTMSSSRTHRILYCTDILNCKWGGEVKCLMLSIL